MADLFYDAEHAKALLDDEVLTAAFAKVRQEALEALALTPAYDTAEIQRLQAIAVVATEVRSLLEDTITRTGVRDGGVTTNEPTA